MFGQETYVKRDTDFKMSETVRIQEMQILRFVQFGIQIRNVLSDFESSHSHAALALPVCFEHHEV